MILPPYFTSSLLSGWSFLLSPPPPTPLHRLHATKSDHFPLHHARPHTHAHTHFHKHTHVRESASFAPFRDLSSEHGHSCSGGGKSEAKEQENRRTKELVDRHVLTHTHVLLSTDYKQLHVCDTCSTKLVLKIHGKTPWFYPLSCSESCLAVLSGYKYALEQKESPIHTYPLCYNIHLAQASDPLKKS